MIPFTSNQRYFLYNGAMDMRKGSDSLCAVITNQMHNKIINGDVFVFINKRHTLLRMICFSGGGIWTLGKRLELGTYEMPVLSEGTTSYNLTYTQLLCITEGIKLKSIKYRKRYTPENS